MSLTKSKSKSRKNRQSKRKTKINKKNNLRGGARNPSNPGINLLTSAQVLRSQYGPTGYGPNVKPFDFRGVSAQEASNLRALSRSKSDVNPNVPLKSFGFKPKSKPPPTSYVPKI
jgi:hypothetical protein